MKTKEYEEFVKRFATISEDGRKYAALGLSGESGEVFTDVVELLLAVTRANESVKKYLRNTNDGQKYRQRAVSELGDVLFYFTKVAQDVDATTSEIRDENVRKLTERHGAGFVKG